MSERFVLVTVRVATEGRRCASHQDERACPFIRTDWDKCRLFDEKLTATYDEPTDAIVWTRSASCLALDGGGVGDGPPLPHRRRRRVAVASLTRARIPPPRESGRRARWPFDPNRGRCLYQMASIYRASSGVWYVHWSRRERQSLRTRDEGAARLLARRLERERADPAYAAASSATVESCLVALREDRVARRRAEGTLHFLAVKSGHLVRLLGAATPLASVDAETCDRYLATRAGEGASPSTIAKELGVLGQALRLAKRRGRYPHDVSTVLPTGYSAGYVPKTRWLTEEQVTRLLAELAPHRARHVAFLAATGARWGESTRARREDVSGGLVTLRGTKTALAPRTLEVPAYARPLLERALAGAPSSGTLHLPWASVRRDLAAACARAALPTVTPNDLRRTAAHWLRHRGVEAGLVAQYLGHVDTRMVERVYGRLDTRELADAIGARVDSSGARTMRVLAAQPGDRSDLSDAVERLEALLAAAKAVARDGIEPPTRGFSIPRHARRLQPKTSARRFLTLARLRVLAAANDVVTAWRAAS